MRSNDRDPLLDQRAVLVLLLGVLAAVGAGVLTVLNGGSVAGAGLAGGGAFAAGVYLFHQLIG
ncbi:hypothetical protein [Streptomyces neyagawaensis]|uniref:hypothetical protein n=1 Tax=Streptomyces neyagawaensis TaxID=42238 RepID=UPI0006E20C0D|nr:hypothetical protein [Streptomyces neyagawaensis]MCL6737417.1 hypothetical protein [Streptomyces neyagawaensis]